MTEQEYQREVERHLRAIRLAAERRAATIQTEKQQCTKLTQKT
jgi:hypothetical protein